MLFVFHVNIGTMMTFDMNLALESVENLKSHLEKACGIPRDKQVLIISGGECLDAEKRVCSYSAGTDTSPIFLFSKAILEVEKPPALPFKDYGSNGANLVEKLKRNSVCTPDYDIVMQRAQLGQQFVELAKEHQKIAEELVYEQHLQHQAWTAVIANLGDIVAQFKKRSEIFVKIFDEYLAERESYSASIKYFHEDLTFLQKIPLLSVLIDKEKSIQEIEASKVPDDNVSNSENAESTKVSTLLDWITTVDSRTTMELIYEHCAKGLELLNTSVFDKFKGQIKSVYESALAVSHKEVEGITEILSNLEKAMRTLKSYVQCQTESAQFFLQHQTSFNNCKDQSVLADLCAHHKTELEKIVMNHMNICEEKGLIIKAKGELISSLHMQLRMVREVEDNLLILDHQLVMCLDNVKRLRLNLEVLVQIHLTPTAYLGAVAEVVRRRTFSQAFLLWASELACHLLTIYNDEVTRRKEFHSQFKGHFLSTLFPGMEDLPPPFATQAPPMFDTNLPKITMEDVENLKKQLPDLADSLHIPDLSAIVNFFLIRSTIKKAEEKEGEEEEEEKLNKTEAVEEKLVQAVNEVGLASNLDHNLLKAIGSEPCLTTPHGLPHLKDLDRGCESETDTEEFEKVGQSPLELNFDKQLPSHRPGTQDASTLTEDNLQISRTEHDKLKSFLVQMHNLTKEATVRLRSELTDLRTQVLSEKNVVSQHYESLGSSWENLLVEFDFKEKELVESIKKDHELTVNDFKRAEQEKNQQIQNLLTEKNELEVEVLKSCENLNNIQETLNKIKEESEKEIEKLRNELQEKELEKEKNIKEITERLNREHNTELQNIRSRFRLMTMERSPPDSSLEWSSQYNSSHHNTLLAQMTENFEIDKEKAVSLAIEKENEKWEQLLNDKIKEMETGFEQEKECLLQDVVKRISEEKDKQIEMLMEREKNLDIECVKHKSTIQKLSETGSHDSDLIDRINTLQNEKQQLEMELERVKGEKPIDLSSSVALVEGKDATTSPIKQKEVMTRSEVSGSRSGKVNIESCKAGDIVVVLWDPNHESFRILQENKHMYFLHSEYFDVLGLEIVDGKPNKFYAIGVVVDKEYCHARKSENRYKVLKGTKFFRVKVQPATSSAATKEVTRSLYHQRSTVVDTSGMSQSQSTISTITEIIPEDKSDSHSLPPSPTRGYPTIVEGAIDELDASTADVVSVEKSFAQDSGIVDNIEQAAAALDVIIASESNESSTR